MACNPVSILGLVDKRLRLREHFASILDLSPVSILGLVDKRLRLTSEGFFYILGKGFQSLV
jgi:hypothetical protein